MTLTATPSGLTAACDPSLSPRHRVQGIPEQDKAQGGRRSFRVGRAIKAAFSHLKRPSVRGSSSRTGSDARDLRGGLPQVSESGTPPAQPSGAAGNLQRSKRGLSSLGGSPVTTTRDRDVLKDPSRLSRMGHTSEAPPRPTRFLAQSQFGLSADGSRRGAQEGEDTSTSGRLAGQSLGAAMSLLRAGAGTASGSSPEGLGLGETTKGGAVVAAEREVKEVGREEVKEEGHHMEEGLDQVGGCGEGSHAEVGEGAEEHTVLPAKGKAREVGSGGGESAGEACDGNAASSGNAFGADGAYCPLVGRAEWSAQQGEGKSVRAWRRAAQNARAGEAGSRRGKTKGRVADAGSIGRGRPGASSDGDLVSALSSHVPEDAVKLFVEAQRAQMPLAVRARVYAGALRAWTESVDTMRAGMLLFLVLVIVHGGLLATYVSRGRSDPPVQEGVVAADSVVVSLACWAGWASLLYFGRASRRWGHLVVIAIECVGDIIRFSLLFMSFLLGFSFAFVTLVVPKGDLAQLDGLADAIEFYGKHLWKLFTVSHSRSASRPTYSTPVTVSVVERRKMGDPLQAAWTSDVGAWDGDLATRKQAWLGFILVVLYGTVMVLLLFNIIIAMMASTFTRVQELSEETWHLQWAQLLIQTERRLPQSLRWGIARESKADLLRASVLCELSFIADGA